MGPCRPGMNSAALLDPHPYKGGPQTNPGILYSGAGTHSYRLRHTEASRGHDEGVARTITLPKQEMQSRSWAPRPRPSDQQRRQDDRVYVCVLVCSARARAVRRRDHVGWTAFDVLKGSQMPPDQHHTILGPAPRALCHQKAFAVLHDLLTRAGKRRSKGSGNPTRQSVGSRRLTCASRDHPNQVFCICRGPRSVVASSHLNSRVRLRHRGRYSWFEGLLYAGLPWKKVSGF